MQQCIDSLVSLLNDLLANLADVVVAAMKTGGNFVLSLARALSYETEGKGLMNSIVKTISTFA